MRPEIPAPSKRRRLFKVSVASWLLCYGHAFAWFTTTNDRAYVFCVVMMWFYGIAGIAAFIGGMTEPE
jgi:hypothetical protein